MLDLPLKNWLDSKSGRIAHASGVWGRIIDEWSELVTHMDSIVRNGKWMHFWLDTWYGNMSFRDHFSDIFDITRKQGSSCIGLLLFLLRDNDLGDQLKPSPRLDT